MRKTYLLILFILMVSVSFKSNNENFILTISEGEFLRENKETYFIVPVTLHNNTNDTLKYFSMSCSWPGFYQTNNKALTVPPIRCDKNTNNILVLNPNDSCSVKLKLLYNYSPTNTSNEYRIGFKLQVVESRKELRDREFKNPSIQLWSNVLILK